MSMQQPCKRLKFENAPTVVSLLFAHEHVQTCVQRLQKGWEREKPVPGHHL